MTVAHHAPYVGADDAEEAAAWMRGNGHRVSAARRLVLEALFAAPGPTSAEEIAAGLDGRLPVSDLASVYRNLEMLERLGLVRHFHAGHGAGMYALAREQEYAACSSCGEVSAFDAERLDEARELIRRELGISARFDHFPIVGLCARCGESNQSNQIKEQE